MKKFMVIYYANQEATKKMEGATPEQMQEGMKPWMAWAEKCGDALVDMGTPLGMGMDVTKTGSAEGNKDVVGYSVLQAENMDSAVALLTDHPHLEWAEGCDITVHESMPLPGME